MEQAKKPFIEMLPKIYGLYTGGFIAFIILMAILEQMGLGAESIGNFVHSIYRFGLCGNWVAFQDDAGFKPIT
ncbi:MAG: hypothetical protein CM1200mP16_15470 [Nitrospina sp.]|nr:MAG: hypothetical protein CM1200mP16_15470 [Nitrospina sp.]